MCVYSVCVCVGGGGGWKRTQQHFTFQVLLWFVCKVIRLILTPHGVGVEGVGGYTMKLDLFDTHTLYDSMNIPNDLSTCSPSPLSADSNL